MTDIAPPLPIEPETPRTKRAIVFRFIKIALVLTIFTLVIYALRSEWRKIDFTKVALHPIALTLGVAALFAVEFAQMISYRTLLGAYATPPRWRSMPTIAWIPPLGKYIPGAAVPAAVSMLRRFDIPIGAAVSVVLVLDGLAVLAGLITGAPLLLWQPIRERSPHAWILAIPVILIGMIGLWPTVFGWMVNIALRKLRRPPLPKLPTPRQYLVPLICAFVQWIFAGMALLWLVQGVTGIAMWRQFPILMAFAALSQTLGYLMVFAPGGLGVREAVLLVGLTPLIGPVAALVVPMRAIAQIFVDVLSAFIGLLLMKIAVGTPG